VLLHVGFILFGGLLFLGTKEDKGTLQQVELLSADDEAAKEDKKPEEDRTVKEEEMAAETEQPPDSAEILRSLELAPVSAAPALEAASLAAIEQALSGLGGGGDFADALSFSSGGRIGERARRGARRRAGRIRSHRDRPVRHAQSAPLSAEMRGKRLKPWSRSSSSWRLPEKSPIREWRSPRTPHSTSRRWTP
jgi:hypothetical protein